MMDYNIIHSKKKTVIILHEIYGINHFVKRVCDSYEGFGYDVYCPNLIYRENPYDYSENEMAYQYFNDIKGFEQYRLVNQLIEQIRPKYDEVILIGFSAGATIAWSCSENPMCDKVIGYYGSRIRDYADVKPTCPVLLIFACEDSFDVVKVAEDLNARKNVAVHILAGKHGFMDSDSVNYNVETSKISNKITNEFLNI